ncbi:F0F1 ATP synthase subunit epsilon [Pedomonas sp. V897]|uniref:F0F1 ATP synthase subunit epsilon n=1 Tax=Pedomonas sp. V897 TaxID=3446482 RepID=UPI003EE34A60
MADKLHFELVSPERLLSSAEVEMVVVPGEDGDFGVLAGHAPLMATIRPGVIEIHADAGAAPERVFIDGGFAEVNEKGLTILAQQAIPVAELNPEELARKVANAREDVNLAKTDQERLQAQRQLAILEAQLAAVRH